MNSIIKVSKKHLNLMISHLVMALLSASFLDKCISIDFLYLFGSFSYEILGLPALEMSINEAKRAILVGKSDQGRALVSKFARKSKLQL